MKNVHEDIINRYLLIIIDQRDNPISQLTSRKTDINHLGWMLCQINTFDDKEKAMRWLGYVQGVLAVLCLIDIDEEIEFCRRYFRRDK